MPRVPAHALIWSADHTRYELYTYGQLAQRFRPGDDEPWQAWLATQRSFAFSGASGCLMLRIEARPSGARYWYAYYPVGGRPRKRYLGKTTNLTLARLEQTAWELSDATAR